MTRFFILMGFSINDMTPYIYAGLQNKHRCNFINKVKESEPSAIIKAVCQALDIDERALLSSRRDKPTCEARCIAMYLILNANPELTLKYVGYIFKRDHSTVIYNRDLFEDLNGRDRNFTIKINKVKQLV